MEKDLNWREFVITRAIKASGYSAIVFVGLIFFFLLREGLPTLGEVPLSTLFSDRDPVPTHKARSLPGQGKVGVRISEGEAGPAHEASELIIAVPDPALPILSSRRRYRYASVQA